jgi:tRNA(Ile)-lysidine synthase
MKSTRKTTDIPYAVQRYFRDQGLVGPIRLVVAVSGGADSTCLLTVLHSLRDELDLSLTAAHLDHGIRSADEAGLDAEFLRELCAGRNIPLIIEAVPGGLAVRRAHDEKRSLEDVARELRHAFLRRQLENNSCNYVALGHTRTDARESSIMNFFRGYDPTHLDGIPAFRPPIIRPLMQVDRPSIELFLGDRGLGWREDSTNAQIELLRNKVRRVLMPVIGKTFPGYAGALDATAEKAGLLRNFVEKQTENLDLWHKRGGQYQAGLAEFAAADPLLRMVSLYRVYNLVRSGRGGRLPFAFLKTLLEPAFCGERPGCLQGHAVRIEWSAGTIRFGPLLVRPGKRGYLFKVNERMYGTVFGFFQFQVEKLAAGRGSDRNSSGILRSRRSGDSISVHGARKKLKTVFNEMKVDESVRDLIPVLQYGREIFAVDGRPFNLPIIRSGRAGAFEIIASSNSGEARE